MPFDNLTKSQVHLELPRTEVQMQHVTRLSADVHCTSRSSLVGCLLCLVLQAAVVSAYLPLYEHTAVSIHMQDTTALSWCCS